MKSLSAEDLECVAKMSERLLVPVFTEFPSERHFLLRRFHRGMGSEHIHPRGGGLVGETAR